MNLKSKIVGAVLALGLLGSQIAPAAAACIFGRDSVTQAFTCSIPLNGCSLQALANSQQVVTIIQRAARSDHSGFNRAGTRCQQIITNQTGRFTKSCPSIVNHSLSAR
jgi:hypothetical protein